jgi:hypothetical protein
MLVVIASALWTLWRIVCYNCVIFVLPGLRSNLLALKYLPIETELCLALNIYSQFLLTVKTLVSQ